MVPTIGFMIGSYVIIRMISFCTRKGERKESTAVQILAVLNILFTLGLMLSLLFADIK